MDTNPSGGDVKRRRRRSSGERSGRGLTTANSFLQHQGVSKFAPLVMGLAAALYVVASGGWIYHAATLTGSGLPRGITKTDTRYVLGPPGTEGATQWVYERGTSTLAFNYNDRDQAESILCYAKGTNGGACPAFLSVGVNTTEDAIWRTMGTPDLQKYYGDTKVIRYSGLGIQFTLERYAVKGIAFVPLSRPDLTIFQAGRLMLP